MFTKHDFINIAKLYLFTCKLFKETRQQKTNKKNKRAKIALNRSSEHKCPWCALGH